MFGDLEAGGFLKDPVKFWLSWLGLLILAILVRPFDFGYPG
jgi:hypothetical protein